MPRYRVTWRTASGAIETDGFFVENDPDPPGKWKVFYKFCYEEHCLEYWTILPKATDRNKFLRRSEVLDRDLSGIAVGWWCELASFEKIEAEPRRPSLILLARSLEKSRATLEGREPRRFIDINEDF